MKVLHIPYCFYPDPVGGTEIYVESLAQHQRSQGIDAIVAIPAERDEVYTHVGLPVHRYRGVSARVVLDDLYGAGDAYEAAQFGRLLDNVCPDIVHMHVPLSLLQVTETQRRGIPIVFTCHLPISCGRGTLMRWGSEICDGHLNRQPCTACTLHGLGLQRAASQLIGCLPPIVGHLLGTANLSGGIWTALRMSQLMQLRHAAFHALMDMVNRVVVVCQWTAELLALNGVSVHKIMLSRHGLPRTLRAERVIRLPPSPLRIAFLGRMSPVKGPDVLISAVRRLPMAPLELHLYGVVQNAVHDAYLRQLHHMAADDSRIVFHPAVPVDQVIEVLRNYHVLAVPSRWLETGPLVVLEAFAAGIPVIGSDLGGIAELVEHDINGVLLPVDAVDAWSQTIDRLAADESYRERLRAGVRPPRSIVAVANEMAEIYETLIKNVPQV